MTRESVRQWSDRELDHHPDRDADPHAQEQELKLRGGPPCLRRLPDLSPDDAR